MESLPNKKKALFIVEGAKREVNFIRRLTSCAGIGMEIVSVCANIHMLYQSLKKENFYFNIVDMLLNLPGVSQKDKEKLKEKKSFAYTYLIFDLDLQHYDLSKPYNIQRGVEDVVEMINFFNDETDPTIGKIYINYPMIESYRDCKSFFDDDYRYASVSLSNIGRYKEIVSERGLSLNITKYSYENFKSLSKMNLYKFNYLDSSNWMKPEYEDYINKITQERLIKIQNKLIMNMGKISILNTSFFILLDYFGNRNNFYENL